MTNDLESKSHDAHDLNKSIRVWIEEGILFIEHIYTMSTPEILESGKIALALLDQANIEIIPFIIILTNVDKSRYTVSLHDYGKILTSSKFTQRVSRIWAVGVPENLKNHILPMVSGFFGKHFYFVDTLEQAKLEATKYISHPSPLLE